MYRIIFMAVLFLFLGLSCLYSQELWVGKDGNIRNVDARAMVVDGGSLYLATRSEVYKTAGGTERWESIFSLSAGENEVTCLALRGKSILIGTRRGIFRSDDGGKRWRNVFRTLFADKSNVIALDVSKYDPRKAAAVTAKGVFISYDLGDHWKEISANLKNKSLNCIALNKELIYAGGEDGLYFKKEGSDLWERIYVSNGPEEAAEDEETAVSQEAGYQGAVACIAIREASVYIGIDERILYSENGLDGWRDLERQGLSGIVNDVLPSKKGGKIYCATTKGVFEFNKERSRWFELYKGMEKVRPVSDLILDDDEGRSVWALTGKGIYRLESGHYAENQYADIEQSMKTLKIIFDGEPGYAELQKAAMRFAEVDPEKIKRWRNEARLKALLPKVSFGVNKDRSTNSEIYTSASKDYVFVGPDDESNGIDVSVSWELGDLIWSDDQTSIDNRSRLTTQLRNDILDDLRRLYFERKRLQFELMQSPSADIRIRFEKEMRLKELTQGIDDLTDNYLSENMDVKGKAI